MRRHANDFSKNSTTAENGRITSVAFMTPALLKKSPCVKKRIIKKKINPIETRKQPAMVAQACNPSYLGGRD
jgi:hypothetical protein